MIDDAPVFFADIFARRCRTLAEANGHTFASVYSTGTATAWDFPRDGEEANRRLGRAVRDGQTVVIFKRYPSGVWRLWSAAGLPREDASPRIRFDRDFATHFGGSP